MIIIVSLLTVMSLYLIVNISYFAGKVFAAYLLRFLLVMLFYFKDCFELVPNACLRVDIFSAISFVLVFATRRIGLCVVLLLY